MFPSHDQWGEDEKTVNYIKSVKLRAKLKDSLENLKRDDKSWAGKTYETHLETFQEDSKRDEG